MKGRQVAEGHDIVLGLHVAVGSLGLVLGPLAMLAEREPPYRSALGVAYHWSVLGVALTALGLIAYDTAGLWWLAPLAVLSYTLALLALIAPRRRGQRWAGLYARGQGGSYIALVTALLVVSVEGTLGIAAWVLPTLIGHSLIERRVARIRRQTEERTEPVAA